LLIQPRVSAWLEKHSGSGGRFWAQCGLLAVWVFDGYWGVGAGVMALAVLVLAVEKDFARANALKNVLLGVADVACSIVFILYGPVHWAAVVPLGIGVLAGGAGIKDLMARIGHDSERAAMIYQHQARGADKTITGNIDAHVEAERRKPDDDDDTAGALVPSG
jgi:uncharacterized membrane protein YfcA